ncbi:MAG: hypothetical protein RIC35_12690 [Marinoscillum sp.]
MKRFFDISRFWMLLKLELFKSRKGILMTMVISFGMLFFVGFLLSLYVEHPAIYDHTENYAYSLFLGGFILSSLAFNELGGGLKRLRYLTIPVSTFERFLCMWMLTSIGWLVIYTLCFALYTMIANPVGQLIFANTTFKTFDPFGSFAITVMQYYFVLHGIFLLGAAHFRGYVFPKTMVVIILILLVSVGLLYLFLKDEFLSDHYCTVEGECELVDAFIVHPVGVMSKVLFWYVLAPLTWFLSYLGLKDQEA